MDKFDLVLIQVFMSLGWCGQYFVLMAAWPSLRNLAFVQQLPWMLVAYIGGSIVLLPESIDGHFVQVQRLWPLLSVMAIFNSTYAAFFYLAWRRARKVADAFYRFFLFTRGGAIGLPSGYVRLLEGVYVFGLLIFVSAYAAAGFIPAFSVDPYSAKYLIGEYGVRAHAYLQYIRLGVAIYVALTPFIVVDMLNRARIGKAILGMAIFIYFACLILALRRGDAATVLVDTGLAFMLAWRGGRYFVAGAVFYLCVFAFGSSITPVTIYLLGGPPFDLTAPIRGATDVSDMAYFWSQWEIRHWPFSWGRTIFGGLIPYHFDWNISVLTKVVIGADPDTSLGGGFRIPPSVQGYLAYGLIGTLAFAAFLGFFQAALLKALKRIVEGGLGSTQETILIVLAFFVFSDAIDFFTFMTMDAATQLVLRAAFLTLLLYMQNTRSAPALV